MKSKLKLISSVLLVLAVRPASAATLPAGFSETVVASDISNPTAMDFAPDGRLFVCQQNGQLRVIKNDTLLETPFLTVTTDPNGERGLLGVAFDPDFADNQWVYIYYTAADSFPHNRVSRFTANGDVADPGSETFILELNDLSEADNHNGGAIHFGLDGKLYVAVGDNGYSPNSQTLDNLLGKILRINADGSIPDDNPFFNTATGVNRAIWAMGLRNPFTFAIQPGTGRMLINDVGGSSWEEINDGFASANYGWPNCEGACSPTDPSFIDPIYQYSHDEGCAIVGGAFYNPVATQFPPEYTGVYFFADLCGGWIRELDPANANQVTTFATGLSGAVDLKVSADGSLYYLDRNNSAVYRVQASSAPGITQHPQDATVGIGASATFTVAASGAEPLSYQWQRDGADISGAASTSYTIAGVQPQDDGATFKCLVSNAYGSVTSNPARLTVSNNQSPTATISVPADGLHYSAGDTIAFSGSASDPEDGPLPPSAFSWTIVLHHDTHTHPFLGPITNTLSGAFSIPTSGETSANVFYRIHLTVTDSDGAQSSTFVDILPNVVTLTLLTEPIGMNLTLDGQPITAPYAVQSVVGMTRTIGAPLSQQLDGKGTYSFVGWSDGGTQTHGITTPAADTSYTVTYIPAVNNNQSPTATISVPADGLHYNAGDTIAFSGSTSDPEDGPSPPSAFSWTIVLHHDTHTDPFLGPITNTLSGAFSVPTSGETSANVFYRIHLTVTDSDGAQSSTFVDILPNVVTLTLLTEPIGMNLTLDGQPITAPYAVQSVVGMTRTIGAPLSQQLDGKGTYTFVGWSDGGTQTHGITTPAADTSYTATYIPAVNNNQSPTATISVPADGLHYNAGDTIAFLGSASDPEDGPLPPSAFSWTIVLHHDTHTDPFLEPITNTLSGAFSIPTSGETSANVFYRIHLTVTDSDGAQSSTFVDILPNVVTLSLLTEPIGMNLTLDGQPITAPYAVQSVVGMTRTIGAPLSQQLDGKGTYTFVGWSDGGTQTHDIMTPAADTSYTATYIPAVNNNQSPTATISVPADGLHYNAGDTIAFSGSASDPEDGQLPPSAFSWTILFHHDTHTHPFLGPITNTVSGAFTIPASGETSANVFYRIHLTVTDSDGAQASTFVDVLPNVVTLTLLMNPINLQLTLDGQPITTPYAVESVVGMTRTIGAPSPQQATGNRTYSFVAWSDGGAQTHDITTPAADTSYTATYIKNARR